MHTVMPKNLRKATEPPKIFIKDYSVDVAKLTADVIQKVSYELGIIEKATTSSDSSSTSMESGSPVRTSRKEKSALLRKKAKTI